MGLQHYTQDMSRIPLKYHTNVLFYTKYTNPTLICRGTDARTGGRTHGRSENIYSIFRDKLLLLGEHVFRKRHNILERCFFRTRKHIKVGLNFSFAAGPKRYRNVYVFMFF